MKNVWGVVVVLACCWSTSIAQVRLEGSGMVKPGGPPRASRLKDAPRSAWIDDRSPALMRASEQARSQLISASADDEPWWENPNRIRDRYAKLPTPDQNVEGLRALDRLPDESSQNSSLNYVYEWEAIGAVIDGSATYDRAGRVSDMSYNYDHGQSLNVLYAAGPNGGVWKTFVLGLFAFMIPVGDNLPNQSVGAFAVHRQDSRIILVGTGDWYRGPGSGLYRTTDEGATWSLVSLPGGTPSWFSKIVSDVSDASGNTFFAATNLGIYRTVNGGQSFSRVTTQPTSDLVQNTDLPAFWYAGAVGAGFMRSTNAGSTWTVISTGLTLPMTRVTVTYAPSNSGHVWLLAESTFGNFGGLYRSTNFGFSFVQVPGALDPSNGQQAFHTGALIVSPTTTTEVYYGQTRLVKVTNATSASPTFAFIDGGHDDYTGLLWNGSQLVISNDGGIYTRSSAGTVSDAVNRSGLSLVESYNLYDTKADWTRNLAGLHDNGQVLVDTDATTKIKYFNGGDGGGGTISSDNPNRFYWSDGAYGGGFWLRFTSADSGLTVTSLGDPNSDGINVVMNDPFPGFGNEVYTHSANRIYTRNPIIGTPWTSITSAVLPPTAGNPTFSTRYLDMAYGGARGWYVLEWGSPAVYYVQEPIGAGSVSNRTPSDPGGASVVYADRFFADRVTFTNQGLLPAKMYLSNNRGLTWTTVHTNLPANTGANCFVVDPDWPSTYYVGTNFGVLRSDNAGASWYRFNAGMPQGVPVSMMRIVKNPSGVKYLRISTYGRGYYQRRVEQNLPRTISFRLILEDTTKTNLLVTTSYNILDDAPSSAPNVFTASTSDVTYTWSGFGPSKLRVWIKARSWLAKAFDVDLSSGNVNLGTIRLKNGDCDGDNEVSILDYLQLSNDYELSGSRASVRGRTWTATRLCLFLTI